MNDNKLNGQTSFETAGIPTPPDQEDITATDMVSEAVEEMMDNIRKAFDNNKEDK